MAGFGYDDFRCALKSGKDVADDRVERRLTAAIAVLDRGWGKPQQTVSANVSVFDQMTDAEQRTMLAALEALRRD